MSDERHGVPSASYMKRISNCAPSFKLGKLFADPSTKDAKTGDKIHLANEKWEDEAGDGLAYDEAHTAEMCIDQRNTLLDEWVGEDDYVAFKEKRLVMTHLGKVFDDSPDLKITRVFSGKADYVAVYGEGALVIDYKTLHGQHDEAASNDQLRSLAVLVAKRHNVSQVRVAIVQPWKGRPTVADFDKAALDAAELWLLDALRREKESTPDQAKAGEWCRFCPAKLKCPAYNEKLAIVENEARVVVGDDDLTKRALFARAAELPHDELAARYEGLKFISWYVNAVEGNVRMRAAENPEFAAKYYLLVEGKAREAIDDVAMVWTRMEQLGVKAEDFTRECKTSKKAVMGLLRGATGEKGKALESIAKGVLEGAVKLSKPPLKLVPVGGTIEDEGGEE